LGLQASWPAVGATPRTMVISRERSRTPRAVADSINQQDDWDSELNADAGVGLVEICRLVCLRERLRKDKDFAEADKVRVKLNGHGVHLDDKGRSWKCSTDGSSGRIPTYADLETGQDDVMLASDDASGVTGDSHHTGVSTGEAAVVFSDEDDDVTIQIKQLVASRERARANKQFEEADRLREELKGLGVDLQDKEKLWSQSGSGRRGVILGYQADGPTALEVQALVYRRERARQDGDYELGDLIRRELQLHKVNIFDKDKTFKGPNGLSGVVPSWSEVSGGAAAPAAALQAKAPPIVITARPLTVSQNDPRVSAVLAIMPELAPLFTVVPAVRGRAALHVAAPASMPARSTVPMVSANSGPVSSDAQKALQWIKTKGQGRVKDADIKWLVSLRERVRSHKDFKGADQIREAMRAVGMDVNDKDKTWSVSDGRSGPIPAWSDVEGAAVN